MSLFGDLDVDHIGICQACLSFVSMPLGDGDVKTAKREARTMTPILWEEGLAEPAVAAARRAAAQGVDGAALALIDLERNGGRSATARAIVLHLAAQQDRRSRARLRLIVEARQRMPPVIPEWN